MKTCVDAENLPKGGPYSHAVKANGLIFVSGNTAYDPETGESIRGDIPRATKLILKNVDSILRKAGSDLSRVVKTTVFLTDISKFSEMNGAYGQAFASDHPARSTVGVRELPGGYDIEIEVIAVA